MYRVTINIGYEESELLFDKPDDVMALIELLGEGSQRAQTGKLKCIVEFERGK